MTGRHAAAAPLKPLLCTLVWQVGHADKNGQCALVHAALKGHADIVNIFLGQDWGTEISAADPQQQQITNQNAAQKTQAVQQALTASASLGHTQARTWGGGGVEEVELRLGG